MPAPPSPLADAYTRLTRAFPALVVTEQDAGVRDAGLPRGGGWLRAADLAADPGALDAFLAHDDAQVRRAHGRPARPDVVAGSGLHRYA